MKVPAITEELVDHAPRFEFFQAVRLLAMARPDRAPVGMDAFSNHEVVRFQPWLSMAFPPSTIREIEVGDDSEPWQMVVSFMGLYGPQGVLPYHYTELLAKLEDVRDRGLREFLDIFNHRLISLFFRANEKYRLASNYRSSADDPISTVLGSWLGSPEGPPAAAEAETTLPRRHLLRYVGLFSQRPRSVKGLQAVLTDYFGGVRVEVDQFVQRWVFLPPSDRGCLSDAHGTNQLGSAVVAGHRIRDRQGKFRIRLGPLDMQDYLKFQPEGDGFDSLCALTREFVGDHLAFEVQPVLRAEEVPMLQLRSERWPPVRLGRTTWLMSGRRDRDADEAWFEAPDSTPLRVQRRQPC